MQSVHKTVVWFDEVNKGDIALVGGKGANLGEMTQSGFPVPNGFAVTVASYDLFLERNEIAKKISEILKVVDVNKSDELQSVSKKIEHIIVTSEIPKEVIMGMVERGGKLHTKHIPNTGKYTLLEEIQKNVDKNASIMTDNYAGYTQLSKYGYHHFSVNHSASEYTRGEIHTQNIEGVWSQLKRGITGVYRHVSKEYLQSYSDEFSWRYNHRNDINIFDSLLKQVAEVKILKSSQLSPIQY